MKSNLVLLSLIPILAFSAPINEDPQTVAREVQDQVHRLIHDLAEPAKSILDKLAETEKHAEEAKKQFDDLEHAVEHGADFKKTDNMVRQVFNTEKDDFLNILGAAQDGMKNVEDHLDQQIDLLRDHWSELSYDLKQKVNKALDSVDQHLHEILKIAMDKLVEAHSETEAELNKAFQEYGYAAGKGPSKFDEVVDILRKALDEAVEIVKDKVKQVDEQWAYQDPKEFDNDIYNTITSN